MVCHVNERQHLDYFPQIKEGNNTEISITVQFKFTKRNICTTTSKGRGAAGYCEEHESQGGEMTELHHTAVHGEKKQKKWLMKRMGESTEQWRHCHVHSTPFRPEPTGDRPTWFPKKELQYPHTWNNFWNVFDPYINIFDSYQFRKWFWWHMWQLTI